MSIAANSIRTFIFRIITGVNGFLIGLATARLLLPAGKGYYTLIFLIYGVYILIFGNLSGAITYQVTRQKQNPKAVFVAASFYSLGVGLLTILVFWIYTMISPRPIPGFFWVVVLFTPLGLLLTNLSGLFQGLNRIVTLNWIGMISGLIQLLLLSSGFWGLKVSVGVAVAFWGISQLVTVAGGLWVSRRYWWPPLKAVFDFSLLTQMLRFGWQLGLVNIVTYLNYRVDMFLVERMVGTAKLGLYSVAVNGSEILWYTSTAIAVSICAPVGVAAQEQAGRITAKAIRHTLLINLLLGITLWAGFEFLLPVIYTKVYLPSLVPFRILLPGVLAYGLAGIFSTYFTHQLGKPKIPLMISALSMVINIIVCLLLIPRIGMAGGAWATTISYLIAIGSLILIFMKKARISLAELCFINQDDIADYKQLWENGQKFLAQKIKAGSKWPR
jgi:O-antigen/teichoic acid export membrane protein